MVAVVLLAAFVAIELRSRAPLIRLGIFRMRSLTGSNGAMLLVMSGLFAMFYFASLYLQQILHYRPLKAGLAFVPFALGIIVGAGLSQALIRRLGRPRRRRTSASLSASSGSSTSPGCRRTEPICTTSCRRS